MQKPIVTVLIPSYNHALYIEQLLNSIVQQSYGYEQIELIVVDDCSTDNSVAIIQKMADKYHFQLIINKENKGICANLNKGILLATGKYICISGSDDYWALDKLELQVKHLEANPKAAVCSGNVIRVDGNGNDLAAEKQISAPARTYTFKEVFLRDFPFSTTCAMIRKSVLTELGGYDENLKIEDYYMWLKIAAAGYELHFLKEILGYYRIHSTNTIHKSWIIYTEMAKILALYEKHPLYLAALKRLKVVYFPQIAQLNKKKALGLLPAAISNTRFFYRGLFYLIRPSKPTQ
jgi:alpha-1,3-rhamnosyltransferase